MEQTDIRFIRSLRTSVYDGGSAPYRPAFFVLGQWHGRPEHLDGPLPVDSLTPALSRFPMGRRRVRITHHCPLGGAGVGAWYVPYRALARSMEMGSSPLCRTRSGRDAGTSNERMNSWTPVSSRFHTGRRRVRTTHHCPLGTGVGAWYAPYAAFTASRPYDHVVVDAAFPGGRGRPPYAERGCAFAAFL
jgi:hypothetical protein